MTADLLMILIYTIQGFELIKIDLPEFWMNWWGLKYSWVSKVKYHQKIAIMIYKYSSISENSEWKYFTDDNLKETESLCLCFRFLELDTN